ncbi:AAA family ATPase [Starkeya koreensis]|uniref:AAA family ATPase n=1 Tax=Ancylobacter koreensis TaxID=266121 RepID=A0ABT0DK27_9HYPH|nr:AAA family ATPase [Ancylobacter koreensis]MCK0207529.1 AAA family ATPase [Ancylobacter koreensis]
MTESPNAHNRLINFKVIGLFGEFTYEIPINTQRHVTAIIAPNGAGKTICLRLIHGLFGAKWSIFSETDFSEINYVFSNGYKVLIKKSDLGPSEDENSGSGPFTIFVISAAGTLEGKWSPRANDQRRPFPLERYLPFVTRLGGNRWRHDHSGDVFSTNDLLEIYGDVFPDNVKDNFYGKRDEAVSRIIGSVDCRLIETQRLLILRDQVGDRAYYGSTKPISTLAITQKAQKLKDIIAQEISRYATLSQLLDRSFPRRVIQSGNFLTPEQLQVALEALDEKRAALTDAGILDVESEATVEIPSGTVDSAIARVLSVYIDDTRDKLASLDAILAKVRLFKSLIDERFSPKEVRISKKSGVDVIFHGDIVPLGGLSSGEQHQLVLFFELLFEIGGNSLILIDEPELSLHVSWQKKFIADLMQIIKVNSFDVILATHSPQLIGRWSDLVIELGPVDDAE